MALEDAALTIGRLANASGVGVETIRFYEREGLLPEPPRKRSGYRQYPADAVARVLFIRRAKELGFTLKEITELLKLRVDPDTSCADVRALAGYVDATNGSRYVVVAYINHPNASAAQEAHDALMEWVFRGAP